MGIIYRGYMRMLGSMENEMETTMLDRDYLGVISGYWVYVEVMENKMETTMLDRDYIGAI